MSRRHGRLTVLALAGVFDWQSPAFGETTSPPACRDFVVEAAQIAGLPQPWVGAVMRAESGGDARAISSAGALGCMQVMPSTWRDLQGRGVAGPDPFDARTNMIAGAIYLRTMHDRYGWPDALAAYHAGPGRFEDYLASGRRLPAATLVYVDRISSWLGQVRPATVVSSRIVLMKLWTEAPIFIANGVPRQSVSGDEVGQTTAPLAGEATKMPVEQVEQSPRNTIFVVHRP